MNTEVQQLIEQIKAIHEATTDSELSQLLDRVTRNERDTDLRAFMKTLLKNRSKQEAYQLALLTAGLWAVLPVSRHIVAEDGRNGAKVNPFYHRLRKAMLACSGLRSKLKANASRFHFYPEFTGMYSDTVRERVVDMANAHSGMGPKNEELAVLYSLGGFFDWAKASKWADGIGPQGGTTCVMTARGIFHAAGLNMIGQKEPTINTPGGPDQDLGLPFRTQTVAKNKAGHYVQKVVTERGLVRDDQLESKKGFDYENQAVAPPFQEGDIYMVGGDKEHPFLLRGGGALAVHVGIIVRRWGNVIDTVDGGAGRGGEVKTTDKRKMMFTSSAGWTFHDQTKSYNNGDLAVIEQYMKENFGSQDAIDTYIGKQKDLDKWMKDTIRDRGKAVTEGNQKRVEMFDKTLKTIRDTATRRARQVKSESLGERRTVQGWWRPERYEQMTLVDEYLIQAWLNRSVASVAAPGTLAVAC